VPSTSVSRVIGAPRDQVWAVLSDIANARRWNTSWSAIEFSSNQTHGPETRFRARTDDGNSFEFVVSAWVAPEYIEFSPLREESESYPIMLESHGFHLHSEGENATRVELIAQASTHGIKGWLLGTFFWRGYQKGGLSTALETLDSVFAADQPGPQDEESTAASD
jgi:uncharacterized protein YndB with AHSA1/START domain